MEAAVIGTDQMKTARVKWGNQSSAKIDGVEI
jgi:hypothetical protein